ncbi:hypothetical protein HDU98_008702 [Podochytrium sp. JEL0797]|nr:hypothetical protein HDU98_008702 [Podochytrium sp. JEL0797]
MLRIPLSDASLWTLAEHVPGESCSASEVPVASFPTDVYHDLLAAGLIPDPFVGTNETLVQWVADRDWKYTCRFSVPMDANYLHTQLCLDGLDTVARVSLNQTHLATSDNMFIPLRINLDSSLLKPNQVNVLEVILFSAKRHAKKLEHQHGKRSVWNGDPSRVFLRKAQYHWGWDWGPTLVTCGVWRDVRLECFEVRIKDMNCIVEVHESLQSATVTVALEIEIPPSSAFEIEKMAAVVSLQYPSGANLVLSSFRAFKPHTTSTTILTHTIQNPELWFPVGSGPQPLYRATATLLSPTSPTPLDTCSHRFGIRRLQLIEQRLPPSDVDNVSPTQTSFFFRINNRPILIAGSNWIPADTSLSRVNRCVYENWLALAVQGNQNMVRVWGGGVYESDAFYETCDEMGVLVWQDFLFACGAYPAHKEFLESVEEEVSCVVKRLRRFASVVIFVGNNEDYAFAESEGLGYDPKSGNFLFLVMFFVCRSHTSRSDDPTEWLATKFPARIIYERVLPQILSALHPSVPYKPGSPWTSLARPSSDPNAGDIHQWNVWHGSQEPYQNYGLLAGRFVSEFGMQGFPCLETVREFFDLGTDEREMTPLGQVCDAHNKATGFVTRIAGYLLSNLRVVPGLEGFVYATQLMQAEAIGGAYRAWRREWGSDREGRKVGGALVWQLNDCWPCVSWSVVDYFLRPKGAYFAMKRELRKVVVNIERTKVGELEVCDVFGVNVGAVDVRGTLVVTWWEYASGVVLGVKKWEGVVVPENAAVLLVSAEMMAGKCVVVSVELVREDGSVEYASSEWPQPLRYLPVITEPRGVKVEVVEERVDKGSAVLKVSVKRPVKGLNLKFYTKGGAANADVRVSDNMMDVMPGWAMSVRVESGWSEGTRVLTDNYE